VLLQDARMSGGVPGLLGYVAGQSGVGSSVLMSPFLMCVVGYSFLNELPFAGQMASFYTGHSSSACSAIG